MFWPWMFLFFWSVCNEKQTIWSTNHKTTSGGKPSAGFNVLMFFTQTNKQIIKPLDTRTIKHTHYIAIKRRKVSLRNYKHHESWWSTNPQTLSSQHMSSIREESRLWSLTNNTHTHVCGLRVSSLTHKHTHCIFLTSDQQQDSRQNRSSCLARDEASSINTQCVWHREESVDINTEHTHVSV